MGWEVPRLVGAMETAQDFYLGLIAQVKMHRCSHGRTALVGDARLLSFTGHGTNLAIVGTSAILLDLLRSTLGRLFAGRTCRPASVVRASPRAVPIDIFQSR
jgi:2-polyprenyl-6-methoxyphenol hydroxylase-like FAD-dependent oxidoreductase